MRWRAALCACLSLAGALAGGSTTLAAPTAHFSANARSTSLRTRPTIVRESPFGLSIEYQLLERVLGAGPCPNETLIAKLRELGSPSIRIGGDSQDLAGPTAAYHYVVPPSFWTTLGCLARATGAPIVVGLNFAGGSLEDQQSMIAAAEQAIPAPQLSFSLGNEPDLYQVSHLLPNDPGFVVPAFRGEGWAASVFADEWLSRRAQLGSIALEGPDLAGTKWQATIVSMLKSHPPSRVDAHGYPTVACGTAGAPTTAARLLSKHASVGLVEKLSWLAETARSIGRPAVISETNSASCGGKAGVSDSPVSSIWAVRYDLAALLGGFSQVRFHSAGTSYDPLAFEPDGTIALRPLAHGLLFLHRWLPIGSHLATRTLEAHLMAVDVAQGAHHAVIASSFSDESSEMTIAVPGDARRLRTGTLTTAGAIEAIGHVSVHEHRARVRLRPNTVVAIRLG